MLIGVTGPSSFGQLIHDVVENHYKSDIAFLYHNNYDNLRKWVNQCNGVILIGGPDVHPSMYGESIHNNASLTSFDTKRDRREAVIIAEALFSEIPILGICRGHQILGVHFGMKLIQDISKTDICHNPWAAGIKQEMTEPAHTIDILNPKQWDGAKYGFVNSAHHQALSTQSIARKVNLEAVASTTDNIEIIEAMSGEGWFSVQWHPECDYNTNELSMYVWDRFGDMM